MLAPVLQPARCLTFGVHYSSLVGLILLAVSASGQATQNGPDGDCGFAKLQPVKIAHFVERGAVSKVKPQYPAAAKAEGVTGTVRVRILVNKAGLVDRTCPEYVRDRPMPNRSLVIAAEAAALQWTFNPNFGLDPSGTPRFKFAEGVLIFEFVLDEPKKDDQK